ncbi:MAG: ATPase [Chelatococcus sp.]|nr:ATPase [Chelatococcus sp. HY11]MBX3546625.1 ATPase [Chelatococcus sp.]CAH1669352.1 conserved hypothetical protein [Hyphomicrobiales bacterium]CAH1679197.1 conserved hypothetical protein [Hyphomicrobiales bacterium]
MRMNDRANGTGQLSAAAVRLLTHLAARGASARQLAEMPDDINLFVERRGVTLGAGRLPIAAAGMLVAHDLAIWEGTGPRRTLAITSAGVAHVRRRDAEPEERFLSQHINTAEKSLEVEGVRRKVRVDEGESPLAWLRARRDRNGRPFVDAVCFEAGERLRADLTFAQLLPKVTMRWTAGPAGQGGQGPAAATDAMIAARQRARRALQAVGSDFAGLLMDVCGFLKGLETIERERGWPPRSGKVILQLALRRLAEAYGLSAEAEGKAEASGIRWWHAPIDRMEA